MEMTPKQIKYLDQVDDHIKADALTRLETLTQARDLIATDQDPRRKFGHPRNFIKTNFSKKILRKVSILKKLIYAWLILLILLFISAWLFIKSITPIFHVNESDQRIILLGGLVDIDGRKGKVKIGNTYSFNTEMSNSLQGSYILEETFEELTLDIQDGNFNFITNFDKTISWNCKIANQPHKNFINEDQKMLSFNLKEAGISHCDIAIPQNIQVTINGEHVNLVFEEPEYDLYANITGGEVKIKVNPELIYNFDLRAKKGKVDIFSSSKDSGAYEFKIYIDDGNIISY
jgi:hypothetical protein